MLFWSLSYRIIDALMLYMYQFAVYSKLSFIQIVSWLQSSVFMVIIHN